MPPVVPPHDDDDERPLRPLRLSREQWAFLRSLDTAQRVANIVQAGTVVGDLDADALAVIRYLNSDDGKPLRKFLLEAKPELLEFLTELRKKEIEDIGSAIQTAIALKRAWSLFKAGFLFALGAFIGMVTAWDKIAALFKSGTK